MKLLQKLIFLAGLITLGALLWKMDAPEVWRLVLMVGWGFSLIIVQETIAHVFNAYGWRLAFRADQAAAVPFKNLMLLRVIGDGVNYLTPSAQLAGEFTRAALLGAGLSVEARTSSVVIAKFAQGFSQFLFVLFGIALYLHGRIPALRPYEGGIRIAATAAAAMLVLFILYEKFAAPAPAPAEQDAGTGLWSIPRRLKLYLRGHPGRFSLSILAFMLGYVWGAFEVYWICRFIGLPVSSETAMLIEVLSSLIDGMLFMVPAKVGTQEAGKTAIFVLLGLPAQSGLAFGIVRHIRELSWASLGLLLYSTLLKKSAGSKKRSETEALEIVGKAARPVSG
ncbi:MAG: lysylphosphatidylglycerol synthase domain-containing protein [Elusimicrobiota bacterium]